MKHEEFMRRAIDLSRENVANGGGPFGAVIVCDGHVVATGVNRVTSNNDPTAHAEVMAVREACRKMNNFKLDNCVIYSSCEPCPMCLSALYWAGVKEIYYGNTREDAKRIGFDDSFIYDQIPVDPDKRDIPSREMLRAQAAEVFHLWEQTEDKVEY